MNVQAVNMSQGWGIMADFINECSHINGIAIGYNVHTCGGIPDPTGQVVFMCQGIDEGAETHALHDPLNMDFISD